MIGKHPEDRHDIPRPDGPVRKTARTLLSSAVSALVLASCQAYEPRPLDPAAHRAAWLARTDAVESLERFLERLEEASRRPFANLDLEDGVDLSEGRILALAFNPDLRVARLRVGPEAAGLEHAGLWADPQLTLDVLRITDSLPDPWVIAPGLSATIPLSGRLRAAQRLASAELAAARAATRQAEWSVWARVERVWIEWSAARQRSEETRRVLRSMDTLVSRMSDLAARGELARTTSALFRVEEARWRTRLHGFEGEEAALELRLRSILGLSPAAPVTLVPRLDGAPEAHPPAPSAPDELAFRNPSLGRLQVDYEVAEAALRAALRGQFPDLRLGPLYESEGGQERIGLGWALPLPFFNANRRRIAEARAERDVARAAFEAAYETLLARHAAAAKRVAALTAQRAAMEESLVPLVDQQLEDAIELLTLGEGTVLVLFESLTRFNQTKLDLVDARSAEAIARVDVALLVGPETAPEPSEAKEETP